MSLSSEAPADANCNNGLRKKMAVSILEKKLWKVGFESKWIESKVVNIIHAFV